MFIYIYQLKNISKIKKLYYKLINENNNINQELNSIKINKDKILEELTKLKENYEKMSKEYETYKNNSNEEKEKLLEQIEKNNNNQNITNIDNNKQLNNEFHKLKEDYNIL